MIWIVFGGIIAFALFVAYVCDPLPVNNAEPEKLLKAYNPENIKNVYSLSFKCSNCNTGWQHKYPKRVEVGYCNFGLPSSRHGWIIDSFSSINIKTPYNYHCPTCDNIDDIDIIKREPLKLP